MLAGIFAGYHQAAIENGGEPLPAWLGPLVGIGFCAIAGAFYLRAYGAVWRQRSPRKRRYWLALGVAALVGALIGVWSMADSDTPVAEVAMRSAEHTSELQSLMRISYAVFCLQKKNLKPIHK